MVTWSYTLSSWSARLGRNVPQTRMKNDHHYEEGVTPKKAGGRWLLSVRTERAGGQLNGFQGTGQCWDTTNRVKTSPFHSKLANQTIRRERTFLFFKPGAGPMNSLSSLGLSGSLFALLLPEPNATYVTSLQLHKIIITTGWNHSVRQHFLRPQLRSKAVRGLSSAHCADHWSFVPCSQISEVGCSSLAREKVVKG